MSFGTLISFSKMEGAGNDFVVVPAPPPRDPGTIIIKLCDRRRGVGADGVIWLDRCSGQDGATFRVHCFNRDASG
jgi:diaminopimelate epimerase